MRSRLLAPLAIACLCAACVDSPSVDDEDTGDTETDTTEESSDTSDTDEGTDTSDTADTGDEPTPANLPTPTGECPELVSGNMVFSPLGVGDRTVKLWVGDNPQPGGMLIIYWHAYGSAPDEAAYTLSVPVIEAIVANGGIVAAPYPAPDVGEFPWFVVNGSTRPDDMLLGDEIVACAIEQAGIDPRRIHTTGMSAGGLQTTAYSMARSRYIASAASFSGGAYVQLPFEDSESRFAAMIIHGGDNDIFGGVVNFKTLSTAWYNQLVENGNFAFMCDHGGGHTIPPSYGVSVGNFFFEHPFGVEPSPYAGGLPSDFPADCSL